MNPQVEVDVKTIVPSDVMSESCGWCGERDAMVEINDLRPGMSTRGRFCFYCVLEYLLDDEEALSDDDIVDAMSSMLPTTRILRMCGKVLEKEARYVQEQYERRRKDASDHGDM